MKYNFEGFSSSNLLHIAKSNTNKKKFTGNAGLNYTSNFYRINDWYTAWLPDRAHLDQLHDTKTVYDVRVRYE